MSRKRGSIGFIVLVLAVACLSVGIASAQTLPADTYQVSYYSGAFAPIPSATLHIVNPGTAVTAINRNGAPLNGNLCADIFVFNNDEQAVECCACQLTPDSERTLSIRGNLLSNPVNADNETPDGVLKIVSTRPVNGLCPLPTGDRPLTPAAGLRAWATHIQTQGADPVRYVETEEEFAPAPLTGFEWEFAELQCSAIVTSGSRAGICSCGYGD